MQSTRMSRNQQDNNCVCTSEFASSLDTESCSKVPWQCYVFDTECPRRTCHWLVYRSSMNSRNSSCMGWEQGCMKMSGSIKDTPFHHSLHKILSYEISSLYHCWHYTSQVELHKDHKLTNCRPKAKEKLAGNLVSFAFVSLFVF